MIRIFTSPQQQKGEHAENLASEKLKEIGHELFTRNDATPFGEIDIVTRKNGYLYFWEVKSYTRNTEDKDFERISQRKLRKILQSVNHLLATAAYSHVSHENIRVCALYVRFLSKYDANRYTCTILEDINI